MVMKKQPIFQVPPCSKQGSHGVSACGFTFLEVMIALLMCMLMVSVISSSLYTVLQAEQLSIQLNSSSLALETLACRVAVQTIDKKNLEQSFAPDWILTQGDLQLDNGTTWNTMSLAADETSSVVAPLAVRVDLADWH